MSTKGGGGGSIVEPEIYQVYRSTLESPEICSKKIFEFFRDVETRNYNPAWIKLESKSLKVC
jgi:hypothetical protein